MIVAATLAGTAASLAALGHLATTDPKRRRAFRLPPVLGRRPGLAWGGVLAPGAAVAWLAGGGGFLVWFGAVTVAGWGIAALRPERAEAARQAVATAGARLGHGAAALGRRLGAAGAGLAALRPAAAVPHAADRIAHLEARVATLEAELAALRGAPDEENTDEEDTGAVVVELPRPARR